MPRKLPVTVISGLPGVGKTTLLRQILAKSPDLKIAVIQNGLAEQAESVAEKLEGAARVVRLDAGCACCSLREDLLDAVASLSREDEFDYLLIESAGSSEPLPIAELFVAVDTDGQCLHDHAPLDTMVTIIDATTFRREFDSIDELSDRSFAVDEDDQRNVVDLIVDQVEFADVIVIGKCDLVDQAEADSIESLICRLNPEARVVRSGSAPIDPDEVIKTHRFDPERIAEGPEWQNAVKAVERMRADQYGFTSLVFRSRRPVHPMRFYEFVQAAALDGVIRSKGFVWLASRHDWVGLWSQAGKVCGLTGAGSWWATAPPDEWPDSANARADIVQTFEPEYGDRRQEIIFIGQNIDDDLVRKGFEACLLTDSEMNLGPDAWAEFEDPWPSWDEDDEDDDFDDEYNDDEDDLESSGRDF